MSMWRALWLIGCCVCACFLQLLLCSGHVVHVNVAAGADVPLCGSAIGAAACASIQYALARNATAAGDDLILSLAPGDYGCPAPVGIVITVPLSLVAAVPGSMVRMDCGGAGRALWFLNAGSIAVRGITFARGFAADRGSAIRIDSLSATGGIVSQRVNISDCTFRDHWTGGGAAVDLLFAGALGVADNLATFSNNVWLNNTSVNSALSLAGAGGVSVVLSAASGSILHNRLRFANCTWTDNTGGNNMRLTGAGAVSLLLAGSHIAGNLEELVDCRFTNNSGGNDNSMAGAGAFSSMHSTLGHMPSADNDNTSISSNTQQLTRCSIDHNSGGNHIAVTAASVNQAAHASGAGGASFLMISPALVQFNTLQLIACTVVGNTGGSDGGAMQAWNAAGAAGISIHLGTLSAAPVPTAVLSNVQLLTDCVVDDNSGGNGATSLRGGVSGAGGIALSLVAWTFPAASTVAHNVFELRGSRLHSNVGGNNGGGGPSGAGASAGAGAIAMMIGAYSYSVGTATVCNNSQLFADSSVQSNVGGDGNSGFAGALGAGAVGVFFACFSQDSVATIQANLQQFDACTINGNVGGETTNGASGTAGAGGVALVHAAYSRATIARILGNTQSMRQCAVNANTGGNQNGGTAGATNGAGAVNIVLAAYSMSVHSTLSLYDNAQSFDSCVIRDNIGGNLNQGFAGAITGAGAAGVSVILFAYSEAISGTPNTASTFDLQRNRQWFRDCTIQGNVGGNGNGGAVGAAGGGGAVSIVLSTYAYASTHSDTSLLNNTQTFERCMVQRNKGGSNSGGGGGSGVGAAGVSVLVFCSSSVPSLLTGSATSLLACELSDNAGGSNNLGGSAGAIVVAVYGPASFRDASDNRVHLEQCRLSNNSAPQGGGLSVVDFNGSSRTRVSVNATQFARNEAVCDAGVCCCSGGGGSFSNVELSIGDAQFDGNSASYGGGALALKGTASFNCTRCLFANNTAGVLGTDLLMQASGALRLDQSTVTMGMDARTGEKQSVGISGIRSQMTFQGGTQLRCASGTVVYQTSGAFGCQRCEGGSYSLGEGLWLDQSAYRSSCLPCSYGGDCSNGGHSIGAVVGFWGQAAPDSSIAFTACQAEYCCTQGAATGGVCARYDTCAAHRTGRLCGECEVGYSEVVGATACRLTSTCYDLAWFLPLGLCLGALLSIYFVMSSAHSSGLFSIICYFYQLAAFMQFATSSLNASVSSLSSALLQLFQLHPGGGKAGGVCVAGLTAVGKELFYFLIPLLIVVPFVAIMVALRRAQGRQRATGTTRTLSRSITHRLEPVLRAPLLPTLLVGVLKIWLYIFSTLITHTFNLLNCVSVAGSPPSSQYLLQAGYVECHQPWQKALIVFVIAMCMFPIMLFRELWALRTRVRAQGPRKQKQGNAAAAAAAATAAAKAQVQTRVAMPASDSASAAQSSMFRASIACALLSSLGSPYHGAFCYWESVLLVHRILVVIWSTFVQDRMVRLLLIFLTNGTMMMAHLYLRPWRHAVAQHLQSMCLALLLLMTAMSFAPATLATNASVAESSIARVLEVFFELQLLCLLLPIAGVLAYAIVRAVQAHARRKSRPNHTSPPKATERTWSTGGAHGDIQMATKQDSGDTATAAGGEGTRAALEAQSAIAMQASAATTTTPPPTVDSGSVGVAVLVDELDDASRCPPGSTAPLQSLALLVPGRDAESALLPPLPINCSSPSGLERTSQFGFSPSRPQAPDAPIGQALDSHQVQVLQHPTPAIASAIASDPSAAARSPPATPRRPISDSRALLPLLPLSSSTSPPPPPSSALELIRRGSHMRLHSFPAKALRSQTVTTTTSSLTPASPWTPTLTLTATPLSATNQQQTTAAYTAASPRDEDDDPPPPPPPPPSRKRPDSESGSSRMRL